MTNLPTEPRHDDIQRLSSALHEFMARWADHAGLSRSWLEHAYAVNQSIGAEPENLNTLYEAMVEQSGEMHKYTKKAFETVLAVALWNHPEGAATYLETIRHYVTQPATVEGRASHLGHIKTALKNNAPSSQYFKVEAESLTHKALLFALCFESGPRTNKDYMESFANEAFSGHSLPESLQAIALIESISPHIFKSIGRAYTKYLAFNNINIDNTQPLYCTLNDALLKTPEQKLVHAMAGIERHFRKLWNMYHRPDIADLHLLNVAEINDSVNYLASLMGEIDPLQAEIALLKVLQQNCSASRHTETGRPIEETVAQGMAHLLNALDHTGIHWKPLAAEVMTKRGSHDATPALTDYILAAGEALLASEHGYTPLKRVMAKVALREMSTAQILEKFGQQSDILGAIFRATNNLELIKHMQTEAKRTCIQHDLGI